MVDPRSDRALYRQLTDDLRAGITSGRYAPGSRLPSETRLMREHSVGRNTVRLAMEMLRAEGLAVTRHGRGTFVRGSLPRVRLSMDRYRQSLTWPTDTNTPDLPEYRIELAQQELPAEPRIAELLHVRAGTQLLQWRSVSYDGSLPQQLITSYVPLTLIARTPLADPQHPRWTAGPPAALTSIGIRTTSIREVIQARMPQPDEARTLAVAPRTPLLTITRTTFAGNRPVEVAVDIAIPADRAELEYCIEL